MKLKLWKVLLFIGAILLVCFLGGLVYIRYDYYTNTLPSYASYPISVPIAIHGVIFLLPSIVCFILSLILRSKSKDI